MSTRRLLAVAALAGATLCLESALTRLLAVAQFYHFAFLVVSLALLGFAASGSLLSVSPRWQASDPGRLLAVSGIAFAGSVGLAYLVVNRLPFDSYAIAIDRRQVVYFGLYYLGLCLPFVCSGLGIASALASGGQRSHTVYAANLLGSAGGALLAPGLMYLAGVPGALLGSALLGILPGVFSLNRQRTGWRVLIVGIFTGGILGLLWLSAANLSWRSPLGLEISSYKSLAYARLHPGYQQVLGRWNAISRLDVVAGAGTRALPGLSYTYPDTPPEQLGLSIDGDDLSPVSLVQPQDFPAAAYLPEAIAFQLRPSARALVLEPGAGLGILQAQAGGARQITAVLPNGMVAGAVARSAPGTNPFEAPNVRTVVATGRVFLQGLPEPFDLIFLPLSDAYHPVTSGAYSLHETYSLTVEMFARALEQLAPDGVLVVTRWLQTPPSEELRLAATLVEALEESGGVAPSQALVAYRGIQTMTFLVQPDGWQAAELDPVRRFAESRKFDLVWAPDISPAETNRFNKLPEPVYYQEFRALLEASDRQAYYANYPFDVRPPRDDHPFFFHFFTWEQTPQILAGLGRTWQPFGGSGFLILLALLALVTLLSALLVLLPLLLPTRRTSSQPPPGGQAGRKSLLGHVLAYFCLIGLAYLLVEIPLIQRWILLLGNPTYAFTAVVLSILTFSGLGSAAAGWRRLPKRAALATLILLALLTPWMTSQVIYLTLGWPAWGRAAAAVLALFPLGILMGLPFPFGLQQMAGKDQAQRAPGLVPWAWAVNGCASVIASVLAAILSLTYGFSLVLWLGAAAYAGALGVYLHWRKGRSATQ